MKGLDERDNWGVKETKGAVISHQMPLTSKQTNA